VTSVVTEGICHKAETADQLFHFLTSVLSSDLGFFKTITAWLHFLSSEVAAAGQLSYQLGRNFKTMVTKLHSQQSQLLTGLQTEAWPPHSPAG